MKSNILAVPIQIGIADGQYAFKPDFDKMFDDMDAEIVAEFSELLEEFAEERRGELCVN